MDDLLERMLAVDLQGRQMVSQAEEQAVKIREENSAAIAELNAQCSARLADECAALEKETLAAAQARREAELKSSSEQLDGKAEVFRLALEVHRAELKSRLLGVSIS